MKVLHLPENIASQASVSVRALRDIGVDARCLIDNQSILQDSRGIESIPQVAASKYSPRRFFQKHHRRQNVLSAIKWADVIHWHFANSILPKEEDLRYAAHLNKPRIVEFWGSDIRIREIASIGNPYIEELWKSDNNAVNWSRETSVQVQQRFHRNGFQCLIPDSEMESYVQKCYWPSPYRSTQRLVLSDFIPSFPDPKNKIPVVAHAPSKKSIKGTEAVLAAIDKLKQTIDFKFILIHGCKHQEAIEKIRNADIFIDQLVIGSHGLATLEAMALGKPTLCYIKPSLIQTYHENIPVINTNQENLTQKLSEILKDGDKRSELGRRSRHYVEMHHDAHRIAKNLVRMYEELIDTWPINCRQ